MYVPKPKKLPSGKWFIQLRLNHESICISDYNRNTCINLATVKKAEYKIHKSERTGRPSKSSSQTLTGLINQYIDSKNNVLSPATIRGYRIIQKYRFQSIMNTSINEIAPTSWQQIINEESANCSPKTLKNAFAFIRTVIETQTELRLPTHLQLPAQIRSERAYLKPDEIGKFVDSIKDDPFAVPALLALSSLRMSEIAALSWDNIPENSDFIKVSGAVVMDENNIYVRKKQNKNLSSARNVPILIPELKIAIARDRKPNGPVLCGDQGEFRKAVHDACLKAGVTDVSIHGLRHSFASLAYHLHVPEKITMEIGGWSDPGTMNKIYTHIAKSDIEHYKSELTAFFEENS